jgi:hypothetical protein
MKEERERMAREKKERLKKEAELLNDIANLQDKTTDLKQAAKTELNKKLSDWDGDKHRTPNDVCFVTLPAPVYK